MSGFAAPGLGGQDGPWAYRDVRAELPVRSERDCDPVAGIMPISRTDDPSFRGTCPGPSPRGESKGDSAPQTGVQPPIAATLLVLGESMDVPGIVRTLKARELWPVIMPLALGAMGVISRWQPLAVILQAGQAEWIALLRILGRRCIPCVLLGTAGQLRRASTRAPRCVHLLLPVEPYEVAQGTQLVIGPPPSQGLSNTIDLGMIKIDLRACEVQIEGERKALPPKEFEILVQLALWRGVPLGATELLGRVWPGSGSATVDDLHTRIWRLRKMIDDHGRQPPVIVNRRGYGYLLNVPQALRG